MTETATPVLPHVLEADRAPGEALAHAPGLPGEVAGVQELTDAEYQQFVNGWIGIPYRLNGEDRATGLDCRTLCVQFLQAQGVAVKGTDGEPLPEAIDATIIARYEAGVKAAGQAVELKDLQRNDVVYYQNKAGRLHTGIWIGYDRILTTGQRHGSHLYRIRREHLRGAVRGARGAWLDVSPLEVPPGHDPITLAIIGGVVAAGAVGGAGVVATVVGFAIGFAVVGAVSFGIGALTSGRQSFDFDGSAGAGLDASPRYAFEGAHNVRSNQYPVPLIYAGLGIRVLSTFEIWNSGQGAETQKRLVVVGEGELGSITEVQLNGEPIANFVGSSVTIYLGTPTQGVDAIAGTNVVGLKNTAYLALTLAASEKLSGDPVITCKVALGRKVALWNGANWTTLAAAASGNPAACVRDYLTLTRERGGCGFPANVLDDASFGAVYDYCDATVTNLDATTEARARLDMMIDTFRPWLDNLQDMMATCGMFLTTDGRKFYLQIEKSVSSVQAFTQDNVTEVEYQTFSKDDRPNRIIGVYIDPTAEGNDARTRVSVDDLVDQAKNPRGLVPREVNLLGLSRQTQAIREVTKVLNDVRANWYALSLVADVEAIALEAGDVFTITHPILGDGVTAYTFRAIRILELPDHQRRIIGKAYTAGVFNDQMEEQSVVLGYTPPPNPFAALSDVTGLSFVESTTVQGDGTAFITADAAWTAIPNTLYLKHYEVAVKKSTDGAYTVLGFTKETAFTAVWDFVVGGSYTVRIRSVNVHDVYSAGAVSATLVISGTPPAPATVANFTATFTDEIVFKWDKNTEKDLAGYEIRTENANFGVQSAALVFRGLASTWTIVTPGSRSPGTYYIRAFNRSGSFSAASASVTPTNAAPAVPTIAVTQWFGFAKIEWTDVADPDLLYYEVLKSATNAWAGEEVLEAKVPGTEVIVQGKPPVDATADAATATTMTDDAIAGKGTNYFVGDRIKQTSGTFSGQEATVTAYNNTTGQVTVASWPSGTPSVGDRFVLKDRAYFKVRGVDTFGAGTLSSAQTIDFTPLAEAELGDQVITARKLTVGELITLSAQIKDAIITSAKILSLEADKVDAATLSAISADLGTITAGDVSIGSGNNILKFNAANGLSIGHATPGSAPFRVSIAGALVATSATITGAITATSGSLSALSIAGTLTINTGGDIRSADYVASTTGFKLSPTGGLEVNTGAIKGPALVADAITTKFNETSTLVSIGSTTYQDVITKTFTTEGGPVLLIGSFGVDCDDDRVTAYLRLLFDGAEVAGSERIMFLPNPAGGGSGPQGVMMAASIVTASAASHTFKLQGKLGNAGTGNATAPTLAVIELKR